MDRDTERRDTRNASLEQLPVGEALSALLGGQERAITAVRGALPGLSDAVERAAERLAGHDGRLVYIGAGTSGRLAVLDGVELTPTFGWPPERLVFLLAGGLGAMTGSQEGAEDDAASARAGVTEAAVGPSDVCIGLAASGHTPYTCAGIAAARQAGALTIAMANNRAAPLLDLGDISILLETGPEVLAGSTRLGAGTAQKAALNLFSTALMARMNRVYAGYMVDMLPTNAKLATRAAEMIAQITGVSPEHAARALAAGQNRVKPAVLIALGQEVPQAEAILAGVGGDLAAALDEIRRR